MIKFLSITLSLVALLYTSSALANPFSVLAGSAATSTSSSIQGSMGAISRATFTSSSIVGSLLAGDAVTCTSSSITGDLGANTVTETDCSVGGTVQLGDRAPTLAFSEFRRLYLELAGAPCTQSLIGTLAGRRLPPGVYCFPEAATLTGTMTLDGPATGIWIFKVGSALTSTNFSVVMTGGGNPCNVYWRTGSGATLTTSNFQGTVLAGAAITVTGGSLNGDALATTAATLTGTGVAGCGG